jgi:molecular chaperone GrpE
MGESEQGATTAENPAEPDRAAVVSRLEAEVGELKDRLLRSLADQENLQRRAARERDEAVRLAAADLVKGLLATADNLSRAIASAPPAQAAADEAMRNLITGVAASERALLEAFARHGIARIDPALGEPFDPHRHHAMFEVEDSRHAPGTVAEILQPGYAYHERLLRPALVGVAKERSDASGSRGRTAGGDDARSGA